MDTLYPLPTRGFTVYTKTNCVYCDKVKKHLTDNNYSYNVILCDDYLKTTRSKVEFLEFIESIAGVPYNTFPMVFYNNDFVGGYNETVKYTVFL